MTDASSPLRLNTSIGTFAAVYRSPPILPLEARLRVGPAAVVFGMLRIFEAGRKVAFLRPLFLFSFQQAEHNWSVACPRPIPQTK